MLERIWNWLRRLLPHGKPVCHVCHGDKRLIRGHEDWGTCQNCGGSGVELYQG